MASSIKMMIPKSNLLVISLEDSKRKLTISRSYGLIMQLNSEINSNYYNSKLNSALRNLVDVKKKKEKATR